MEDDKKNLVNENGEPLGIYNKNEKLESAQSSKNFGEILSSAIKNSISTILNIGGFIVLFSVIISILNSSGFFKITVNYINIMSFNVDCTSIRCITIGKITISDSVVITIINIDCTTIR